MSVSDLDPVLAVAPRAAPARVRARTSRHRLLVDRAARWVVTGGGLAIIASILGILVFILIEVLPLLRPARVRTGATVELPAPALAILEDEHRTHVATLGADGVLRVARLSDARLVAERPLLAAGVELAAGRTVSNGAAFAAATSDGRVVAQEVRWEVTFGAGGDREVRPLLPEAVVLDLDPAGRPLRAFAALLEGSERASAAAQLADGSIAVLKLAAETNDFTGEVTRSEERLRFAPARPLTSLLLDVEQTHLYGGAASGELYSWRLDQGQEVAPQVVSAGAGSVSALAFLIGDRSLVVGQESGAISIWFPVRQSDDTFVLTRIRDFPAHAAPIRTIAPSQRNRSFLVQDGAGGLGLYYSTSERTLWRGPSPLGAASALAIAPKADGAALAAGHQVLSLEIENPHPEVSWRALFSKVWYEGYEKPDYVWQSTGGTDDFESKLSLTPLVFGTLKGTFYSLVLAIPLGVFGAMFASQFLHPRLLAYVKPTVEIMAALPSVVLGFLAGLWLAPMLERAFPALLLLLLGLPLAVLLTGLAWSRLPLAIRGRFPAGSEVGLYLVAVALTLWACLALSPGFERLAFDGSFSSWLLASTGLRYDQRNAVVVGLAMGFAVIPIIFAISEDAFSNVPRNLVAGSLALGANRWQTVTRVVLPTASPGIFSAIMIGFGRAVGETMIVLMATGNTPILELNAFNGFRTLSANIAVEIPEAPHGGTLYRALFLAALLLFLFTFLVNTAAEIVRQRLRRKFAQL